MTNEEELIDLTEKYENKLYEILVKVIDDGVDYSKQNQYDAIDSYIYVQKKLEDTYSIISSSLNTTTIDNYLWLINHFPNIQIKLDDYIEPLVEAARKELQIKINKILNSETYFDLKDTFHEIEDFISSKNLEEYHFLLDGLKLK